MFRQYRFVVNGAQWRKQPKRSRRKPGPGKAASTPRIPGTPGRPGVALRSGRRFGYDVRQLRARELVFTEFRRFRHGSRSGSPEHRQQAIVAVGIETPSTNYIRGLRHSPVHSPGRFGQHLRNRRQGDDGSFHAPERSIAASSVTIFSRTEGFVAGVATTEHQRATGGQRFCDLARHNAPMATLDIDVRQIRQGDHAILGPRTVNARDIAVDSTARCQ